MASVYTNDLRLEEIGSGEQSGSWGDTTNTNLELIAEAFAFGTEAITTNADTHATTIADGATDPGRALFLKYTGTLDSACTITLGPNTVSKMWFIQNSTSGSQNIIISQGSGANVTIPAGQTKSVYSDGAGSGAAIVDAFATLNVVDLLVDDDLTVTDDVAIGGTLGVTGIATFTDDIIIGDGKTIGSASDVDAMTIASNGQVTFTQTLIGTALDISGDIDVDGTTNLDAVDIDGAVNMATTALVTGVLTTTAATVFNGGFAANGACTITTADNLSGLIVASTDADAAVGPTVQLFRNSSSPADNDLAGNLLFVAENDASEATVYANLGAHLQDVTDGTEDGKFFINTMVAGAEKSRLFMTSTETVFNEESADIDFRVESNGNANMLFVDGGNDRVGIGTSDPRHILGIEASTTGAIPTNAAIGASDENDNYFSFHNASDSATFSGFALETRSSGASKWLIANEWQGTYLGDLVFRVRDGGTSSSEAMRIDSSGNVGIGRTDPATFMDIYTASTAVYGLRIRADNAGTQYLANFEYAGSSIGSIQGSNTSTSYNTSSDYRLKTDAQPMTGASARVQALKPVNFEWIADGTRVDGFLAHEAQAVVPESVTGTKDGMMDEEYQVSAATGDIYTAGSEAGFNEVSAAIEASPAYYDVDGNIIKAEVIAQAAVHEAYDAVDEVIHSADVEQPETLADGKQWRETTAAVMGTRSVPDMQGIDQSKMVPLLVASLQEALARITALENA